VRWGLWALFALLLGAFVAHFVLEDRGYVLINFRSYIVEMSVPGLLLVLVALYLGVRGVVVLVRSPLRVRKAILAYRDALAAQGDTSAAGAELGAAYIALPCA